MLVEVEQSEESSASTEKSVTINATSGGNIMYTVPDGKKFTGIAIGSNSSSTISVNGSNIYLYINSTGANSTPVPINLREGDVVRHVSQGVSIHGIES